MPDGSAAIVDTSSAVTASVAISDEKKASKLYSKDAALADIIGLFAASVTLGQKEHQKSYYVRWQ